MTTLQRRLFALRDEKYAAFNARLIPNIDPATIVGVRSPLMRKLCKELKGSPEAARLLRRLPHRYFEEYGLHAALLEDVGDYDEALREVDRLLPYVDNWATCDTLSPRVFARNTDRLLPEVRRWMGSAHEYTCRFGIGMLMRYYLENSTFGEEHLRWVADIDREEYYVRMMQAWYMATALAKQWEATLPVVATLPAWVRRKSIQKACESFRVSDEHKALLRAL